MCCVIVTGSVRSGTTVFRKLIESNSKYLDRYEIFNKNPQCLEQVEFFFGYVKNKIPLPDTALSNPILLSLIPDYMENLINATKPAIPIIDVKYHDYNYIFEQTGNLNNIPWVVNFVLQNNIPIVHLRRKNKLRLMLSSTIAEKTGVWFAQTKEKPYNELIEINLDDLERHLTNLNNQEQTMLHYYRDYKNYIEFFYEDLFEDNLFSENAVKKLSEFLDEKFEEFNRKPSFFQQNPNILKLIKNPEEVRNILRKLNCEWMLES